MSRARSTNPLHFVPVSEANPRETACGVRVAGPGVAGAGPLPDVRGERRRADRPGLSFLSHRRRCMLRTYARRCIFSLAGPVPGRKDDMSKTNPTVMLVTSAATCFRVDTQGAATMEARTYLGRPEAKAGEWAVVLDTRTGKLRRRYVVGRDGIVRIAK